MVISINFRTNEHKLPDSMVYLLVPVSLRPLIMNGEFPDFLHDIGFLIV
jgi:hypothetical protein